MQITKTKDVKQDRIGKDIRLLRMLSDMSQQSFADWLEIPKRSIENWEQGKRQAPRYLMELIKFKVIHTFLE